MTENILAIWIIIILIYAFQLAFLYGSMKLKEITTKREFILWLIPYYMPINKLIRDIKQLK